MKREAKRGKRFLSVLVVFSIISILILAGPATAFDFSVDVSDAVVEVNEDVNLMVSVDIGSFERLPVQYLIFVLDGPVNLQCQFLPDGSEFSGCENVDIEVVSLADYSEGNRTGNYSSNLYDWGYGYGYGYGISNSVMKYNLTINGSTLLPGIYNSTFRTQINSNVFSKVGEQIYVVEPINISNVIDTSCRFGSERQIFYANITGSIKSVWLELDNSSVYNVSNLGSLYKANISLSSGQNYDYRFVVEDISGEITYGDWESVYVISSTSITTDPVNPDGLNNWFVSEPEFSLTKDSNLTGQVYYQWDSDDIYAYNLPFKLENIPNLPVNSSGTLELNWWTSFSCGNETKNTKIYYVDLTDPVITDLSPAENFTVYNTNRPLIGAYIDEVYQSNSGVNNASVVMELDGVVVSPNMFRRDVLDLELSYVPNFDLSSGKHNVSVSVSDRAGRSSEKSWEFYVNATQSVFNMTIQPLPVISGERNVLLNISLTDVGEISYRIFSNKSRFSTLCRDCYGYGENRARKISLKEGENILEFVAENSFGDMVLKNVSVFVDTRDPRVSRTLPKSKDYINYSEFYVRYTEANLKNITLRVFNQTEQISKTQVCESGVNKECWFSMNLSRFNGQLISYVFDLDDGVNKASSRASFVYPDFTLPSVEVLNYTLVRNRLKIVLRVDETNFERVSYIDLNSFKPKYNNLCSNLKNGICDRTISFRGASPNIKLMVEDKAGNSVEITPSLS